MYKVRGDAKIPPDWKQFLSVSENKSGLAGHYTDYLIGNRHKLPTGQCMYVTGGKSDDAAMITQEDVNN